MQQSSYEFIIDDDAQPLDTGFLGHVARLCCQTNIAKIRFFSRFKKQKDETLNSLNISSTDQPMNTPASSEVDGIL